MHTVDHFTWMREGNKIAPSNLLSLTFLGILYPKVRTAGLLG